MDAGIRSLADADKTRSTPCAGFVLVAAAVGELYAPHGARGRVYTLDLDTERTYVLSSLRLAQELFGYPGRASSLVVRLDPGTDAAGVRRGRRRSRGRRLPVQTRATNSRASFYRIMAYEKWGIFFIALLVLVIASFSVVGALAMLIVEKRGRHCDARALGADTGLIRAVFRSEGFLICGLGAAVGVVLGVGASLVQQHFGLIEIPAETFLTKSYPVEFRFADLLAVLASFRRRGRPAVGRHGAQYVEKQRMI